MTDSKDEYSTASGEYVKHNSLETEKAQREYERSKARETRHNNEWKQNPVNINEIVERFAPNAKGKKNGVKYIYYGERYNVIADMASGYLRIQDAATKDYLKLNGTPGTNADATHFKIKRREEM